MELKRLYRRQSQTNKVIINSWPRRHFSLTALYYHLSTYGESITKPTTIGALIVSLSTAFWIIENNPTATLP